MGGFAFYESYDDNEESLFQISTNLRHPVEHPNPDALIYILRYFPHIITDITEDYIRDQAESSSLSKALLYAQVAWFCINCGSRLAQRLPISLLEVSTAAHGFCTLLTYNVWKSKPINVAAPTILKGKEARQVHALLKCNGVEYNEALEMAKNGAEDSSGTKGSGKIVLAAGALQRLLAKPEPSTPEPPPGSVGFTNSGPSLVPNVHGIHSSKSNEDVFLFITLAIYPIVYGLVHFLALAEQFPTYLERVFWLVSSVVITCSGLVWVSAFIYLNLRSDAEDSGIILDILKGFVAGIVPLAHILASGFIIVESFRQLAFLDPATYQLPLWSKYWHDLS
jgi:hypothetical protein